MTDASVPGLAHVTVADIRAPWQLRLGTIGVTVRGAAPRDLPAVAQMHRRCSAKSLLDRYRTGGQPPAIHMLDRHGRDQLSFVAVTDEGRVVATSRVAPDVDHPFGSAELAMLVEDDWQHIGIGRALLRHCAAAAALTRYRQLIAYPGTTVAAVQRLMSGVGTTRLMTGGQRHFHTALPDSARFGLGQFRSSQEAWRRTARG